MTPRRGELWLVDFGHPVGREQSGRRPGLVVSADELNESRAEIIIVVPCTTTRRGLPSHVELDAAETGLDEVSYAKCDDVMSISSARLITRLGTAPSGSLDAITTVLRYLLVL